MTSHEGTVCGVKAEAMMLFGPYVAFALGYASRRRP